MKPTNIAKKRIRDHARSNIHCVRTRLGLSLEWAQCEWLYAGNRRISPRTDWVLTEEGKSATRRSNAKRKTANSKGENDERQTGHRDRSRMAENVPVRVDAEKDPPARTARESVLG